MLLKIKTKQGAKKIIIFLQLKKIYNKQYSKIDKAKITSNKSYKCDDDFEL